MSNPEKDRQTQDVPQSKDNDTAQPTCSTPVNSKPEKVTGETLIVELGEDDEPSEGISQPDQRLVIELGEESELAAKPNNNFLDISLEDLSSDINAFTVGSRLQNHGQVTDQLPEKKNPGLNNYALPGYDKAKLKNETVRTSVINILTFSCGGLFGGIIAWLLTEAQKTTDTTIYGLTELVLDAALYYGIVGATLGTILSIANGISAGNARLGIRWAAAGFVAGALGGFFGGGLAQYIYGTFSLKLNLGFLGQVLLRATGWSIVGLFIGIGQSALAPATKKMRNCIIGGAAGGFLGGIIFQAILFNAGEAPMGRAIALMVIGASIGFLISLIEETAKEAWLHLINGPMAGKQFIIYENRAVIGSAYSCDIVLLKGSGVQSEHAAFENTGTGFIINSIAGAPLAVNSRVVKRAELFDGDTIDIGDSQLVFHLQSSKGRAM